MEANVLALPPLRPTVVPPAGPQLSGQLPAETAPTVSVDGERIVVSNLVLVDPGLAAFVAERPAEDRAELLMRALRVGLLALQDASATLDVEAVRREFEKLVTQTELANERAAKAVEQTLRLNFGDEDGRLPRTLERFLGDRGQLQRFVNDLFDETKRDSAVGRLRAQLGEYFDGDGSKLAQLLDPTRLGSPLYQFRDEVARGFREIGEKLVEIQAASEARAKERAKGTAKGGDFEDLLEAMLGELARGAGDLLDRTSDEAGDTLRSKKGDFVITVSDALARGADLRIVVEAKDRPVSARAIRDELREAKENRSAAVALVVFTPQHAPTGVAPFDIRAGDVYCVIDPEAPEAATLEAAVRLARLLAVTTLDDREVEIDAAAVTTALDGVREQLEAIRGLKGQLTSIGNATKAVWTGLDTLRSGVLARVAEAEAQLRTGG
jgi:hypothetical protein